jgi:hypothetical protein
MKSNKIKRSAIGSSIVAVILGVVLATGTWAGGRVLHHVSVGGPDACEAFGEQVGCDANFSLNAVQFDDFSVNGHFTDQFGHGEGGFHAVIDCLAIVGNEAWVSGVITHETVNETGAWVGLPVATRVVDNGTSRKDPPDQISYSWIGGLAFSCDEMPDVELFDMPRGQVKVR